MMKTRVYDRKSWVFVAFLTVSLVLTNVYADITSVSPNLATQGTTGLEITFTLDSASFPPVPPADAPAESVMIGTVSGTSVARSSQYVLTAAFDIPADEPTGVKDASITFLSPTGESLVYSMTDAFTVSELPDTPPGITVQPQSQAVRLGKSATVKISVYGSVPLRYQWQKDEVDISGETGFAYTIDSFSESDAGAYRCVVSNDYGTVTSDAAILTIDETVYDGTYPIVDTGQAKCYNDNDETTAPAEGAAYYGQDAQIDGNQPDYALTDGGLTVTDNATGLMWTQTADINGDGVINASDKLSYAEAMAYADSTLNIGDGYAGYTDWRLPSIKELYSLMDFRGGDPSGYSGTDTSGLTPFIDTNYFGYGYGDVDAGERIIDAQWASSTLYVSTTMDGNETMFGLNLADGRIKGYPKNNKTYYVYFVRGNTVYGVNNFVDNADDTISDKATGLMWSRDDSGTGLNWAEALAWVQTKNSETYLGYNDWRLANAKEMQSIIDYTRSPDTTHSAAMDSIFNCTQITNEAGDPDYPWFWTGTTHATYNGGGGAGAYICFGRAMGYWSDIWQDVHGAGCQRSDPKSGDPADWPTGHGPQGDAIRIYNYVRCVRDIQCGQPGYVSALEGDLNNDCTVNMLDFEELASRWLAEYEMTDLETIINNWLNES